MKINAFRTFSRVAKIYSNQKKSGSSIVLFIINNLGRRLYAPNNVFFGRSCYSTMSSLWYYMKLHMFGLCLNMYDLAYGITINDVCLLLKIIFVLSLLVQVALLKFTGYKILSNISDTGKAFLIILMTDIFLG